MSEVGVGTIAAGVAQRPAPTTSPFPVLKAVPAPSPLTSIKHAGIPWEIGIAETQQTLVMPIELRGRVAVQVDGGLQNRAGTL